MIEAAQSLGDVDSRRVMVRQVKAHKIIAAAGLFGTVEKALSALETTAGTGGDCPVACGAGQDGANKGISEDLHEPVAVRQEDSCF